MDEQTEYGEKVHLNKKLMEVLPAGRLEKSGEVRNGWITLSGHIGTPTEGLYGNWNCYLIDEGSSRPEAKSYSWQGRELGGFSTAWPYSTPDDLGLGLELESSGISLRYLCGGRSPMGSFEAQIEINPEFLWFWDAYCVGDTWKFTDLEGTEHDLAKTEVDSDQWKIELRAEHLQTFLSFTGYRCVLEYDCSVVLEIADDEMSRIRRESQYQDEHGSFRVIETYREFHNSQYVWSRVQYLMGYSYIDGRRGKVLPLALAEDDGVHPDFLLGLDREGNEIFWSSDPNGLNNYQDQNPNAPMFLTPVYFKSEVLDKYVLDPERYHVDDGRISCLNLWGLEITRNADGLIVVYLGDLGKSLPSLERRRWQLYNVLPEGGLDEGRIRRDFLNQAVSSPNAKAEISNAIYHFNIAFEKRFGFKLVREPNDRLATELRSFTGPTTPSSFALDRLVLQLTKWIVDGIDAKKLKTLSGAKEDAPALVNLVRIFEFNEIDAQLPDVLRQIQGFRSRGGVAHSPNSSSMKSRNILGLKGNDARNDFKILTEKVVDAFSEAENLLSS